MGNGVIYQELIVILSRRAAAGYVLGDDVCDSAVDVLDDSGVDMRRSVWDVVCDMAEVVSTHHCSMGRTSISALRQHLYSSFLNTEPGIDVMRRFYVWSAVGGSHLGSALLAQSDLLQPYFAYSDSTTLTSVLEQLYAMVYATEDLVHSLLVLRLYISVCRRRLLSVYGKHRWNCAAYGMPFNQHVLATITHACYFGVRMALIRVYGELPDCDRRALFSTW